MTGLQTQGWGLRQEPASRLPGPCLWAQTPQPEQQGAALPLVMPHGRPLEKVKPARKLPRALPQGTLRVTRGTPTALGPQLHGPGRGGGGRMLTHGPHSDTAERDLEVPGGARLSEAEGVAEYRTSCRGPRWGVAMGMEIS